jgi:hypothetical protein
MNDAQPANPAASNINPGAVDLPPTHSVEIGVWPSKSEQAS